MRRKTSSGGCGSGWRAPARRPGGRRTRRRPMARQRRVGKSRKSASREVEKIDIPVSDEAAITQTTVYATLEGMFTDAIASKPWFASYAPGTQRTIKYAFYTAAAETLRTI